MRLNPEERRLVKFERWWKGYVLKKVKENLRAYQRFCKSMNWECTDDLLRNRADKKRRNMESQKKRIQLGFFAGWDEREKEK